MDWSESIDCQNCIALNKKLELFELLKQKCSRTDDIAKNLLVLKKSCEKSAKVLQSKTRKLNDVRNRLKELEKAEDNLKGAQRRVAEYQLRIVSLDTKVQYLEKDVADEREKSASLQREKQDLEEAVEQKENEIAAFSFITKQYEEKYSAEEQVLKSDLEKQQEKVKKGKKELQILQNANTSLKTKHEKLVASLLEIFKDGEDIVGEPLKKLKRLISRLQSRENAAKLEAELNSPSMTPDGTTSLDTGIFSDEENFSNPSLANDLQVSSESSDDDFDDVEVPITNKALTSPEAKSKISSLSKSIVESLSFLKSPTKRSPEFHGKCISSKSTQKSISSFVSDSLDDTSSTICPSPNDSLSDDMSGLPCSNIFLSDNSNTDVKSPVERSPHRTEGLVSSNLNCNEASFSRMNSSVSFLKQLNGATQHSEMPSINAGCNISAPQSPVEEGQSLTSPVASPSKNLVSLNSSPLRPHASPPKSPVKHGQSLTSPVTSPSKNLFALDSSLIRPSASLPKSPLKQEPSLASLVSSPPENLVLSDSSSLGPPAQPPKSPVKGLSLTSPVTSPSKNLVALDSSLLRPTALNNESLEIDRAVDKHLEPVDDIGFIVSNDVMSLEPGKASNENDLCDSTLVDNDKDFDSGDYDLELMLCEWNTPTPVMPFSEDSCGFDGKNPGNHDMEPQFTSLFEMRSQDVHSSLELDVEHQSTAPASVAPCVLKISVGTITEQLEYVSTASSPIFSADADFQCKSCSAEKNRLRNDYQQEVSASKDAYPSHIGRFSINKATSPVRVSHRDAGVMPIKELRRDISSSPIKNSGRSIATSPVRSILKNSAVSPIKLMKKIDKGTNPVSPIKLMKIDKGTSPLSPIKLMKIDKGTSPVRVQMKTTASSPFQGSDSNIQTSDVHIDEVNFALSGSKEANLLQQVVEVFGINPREVEGVAVDKTLIDELRCTIEMALRKANQGDGSSVIVTSSFKNSGIDSFCHFNPCEFAEICSQQHYNLHLLAKSKNLEKRMCSLGTRNELKVKRLERSNHKGRKQKLPTCKEDILELKDSNPKMQNACVEFRSEVTSGKPVSEIQFKSSPSLNNENSCDYSSDSKRESSEGSRHCNSVFSIPEDGSNKVIETDNLLFQARTETSEQNRIPYSLIKSTDNSNCHVDGDEPRAQSDSRSDAAAQSAESPESTVQDSAQNCLVTENFVDTSIFPDLEGNKSVGSIGRRNSGNSFEDKQISIALVEDTVCLTRKENQVDNDCVGHCYEEDNIRSDDLPLSPSSQKLVRMSSRKRQSTSSEDGNSGKTISDHKEVVSVRRSPRFERIRVAHDSDFGSKQSYQQGYMRFVKGETVDPHSTGVRKCQPVEGSSDFNHKDSVVEPTKQIFADRKYCADESDVSVEEHSLLTCSGVKTDFSVNSGWKGKKSQPNSKLCDAGTKRSATGETASLNSSKRRKHSVECCSHLDIVNDDSSIPIKEQRNCVEEVNYLASGGEKNQFSSVDNEKVAGSQETPLSLGRVRTSIIRKPSKLQKLRSSVSKVHPLAQALKSAKRCGEKEEEGEFSEAPCLKSQEPIEVCLLQARISDANATVDGNSQAQLAILEKFKGRECQRMAAAASGRTAKLIQLKEVKSSVSKTKHVKLKSIPSHPSIGVTSSPVRRVTRMQPLVRPEDRVSAIKNRMAQNIERQCEDVSQSLRVTSETSSPLRRVIPTQPFVRPEDRVSAAKYCMSSNIEKKCEEAGQPLRISSEATSVSNNSELCGKDSSNSSFLIPETLHSKVTNLRPMALAIADHQALQTPLCDKTQVTKTEKIVEETLNEFLAASSFTPVVLQKAITAFSAQELYSISPVIVRDVVKAVEHDYDSSPLHLPGAQNTSAPSLTPVQQQLVTLVLQLSFQNKHLKQLPHQVLRLIEYRMFRLGKAPEGGRLIWLSRFYAALCRALCLRSQALIFCYDALYAFRGRSYEVVEAVVDVWPHLFPIKPSFNEACPNAQVMLHLLRSHSDKKPPGMQPKKFEISRLKQMLMRLQAHSINSSTLSSEIFSDVIGGGLDTNVTALVLLAKREDEQWALKDILNGKLLPALERWHNGSLDDLAGERVIWIMCSILRALSPDRTGGIVNTLIKLLKSDLLQKEDSSVSPHMQEVIAIGLAILSRHDIENIAIYLMSWAPAHGPTKGYSPHLLQMLTSMVTNGVRPIQWWQTYLQKLSSSHLVR